MIDYPVINPNIFTIGPFSVRWYSMMYIISFIIGFFYLKYLFKKRKVEITKNHYESLFYYIMLGVIIGGRLGYVLFYNLAYYISHPLEIFAVWHGGMSFHGGMVGVIILGYFFCRKHDYSFYKLADPTVAVAPIGLFFGRLGNFINGELYGRVSSVPWAIVFPKTDGRPRHPSQLYELLLEGVLLFIILNILLRRKLKEGFVFWSFILLYGVFRFVVEFFRAPDAHLGYIFGFITAGQILSIFMVLIGMAGLILIYHPHKNADTV